MVILLRDASGMISNMTSCIIALTPTAYPVAGRSRHFPFISRFQKDPSGTQPNIVISASTRVLMVI